MSSFERPLPRGEGEAKSRDESRFDGLMHRVRERWRKLVRHLRGLAERNGGKKEEGRGKKGKFLERRLLAAPI